MIKCNIHNYKIDESCLIWFYDNSPGNNTEDPTEFLAWNISLHAMENNIIHKLFQRRINLNLIKEEEDTTMTFVRDHFFPIIGFVQMYCCLVVMENL